MAKGSYLGSFAEGFINAFLQARRQRMYEQYFRMLMLKNGYNPDTGKYTDPMQAPKEVFQTAHNQGYTTGTTPYRGEPEISSGDGFLGSLRGFESGNQNVVNTHEGTSSGQAQGYYQITTGTWKEFAPKAGVDLSSYPTAQSAPFEVQHKVAMNIPYSRYDPKTIAKMEQTGYHVPEQARGLTLGELSQRFGDHQLMAEPNAPSRPTSPTPTRQGVAQAQGRLHITDPTGVHTYPAPGEQHADQPFQPYHVAGAMQAPPSGQGQVNTLQSMQGDSGRPPLGGPAYQPHTAPTPPAAEQDYWAQRGGAESGMTGAPPAGAIPAARGQMPPRTSTPRPGESFETGYPSSAPGGPAYPPQNMDTVQPQHPDTARYPGWPTPGVTDEQPQTVIPPRGSTTTPQRTAAPSSPERVPLPPDFRDFGMQRNSQGVLSDRNAATPSPAAQPPASSSPVTTQGRMGHYVPTTRIGRGPGTYVQDSPSTELHAPPTWTAENLPKVNTNPRPQYKPPQTYPVQDRRPTPGVDAPNVNQPSQQSPYVPQSQPVIPPAAGSLNAMDDNVLPGESWHAAYGGPVPGTIVAPQQNPTGTSSILGAANTLGGGIGGSAPSMGAIPSPGMGAGAASGVAPSMGAQHLSPGLPINYSAAAPSTDNTFVHQGRVPPPGLGASVGDYSSQYNTAGGNSGGAGAGGNAAGGVSGAASASGW